MSPDVILQALYEDLKTWVELQNGVISVAKDPWQPLEILAERPNGFRVILAWAGDTPDESDGLSETEGAQPAAYSRVEIFLSRNTGLAKNKGLKTIKEEEGKTSLVGLVSQLRARALSLEFSADDEVFPRWKYEGCDPVFTPDGWPLGAYKIKMSIMTAVDLDDARPTML